MQSNLVSPSKHREPNEQPKYNILSILGINAPYINGIMGFSDHCFAFYISDRKQYNSKNGFNPILLT